MNPILNEYPTTLTARLAHLEASRNDLLAELSDVPAPAALPLGWSVSEIAYHLHLVERGITRLLRKTLTADSQAEPLSAEALRAEWERTFTLADSARNPVQAPSYIEPKDAPSLPETVALLAQSRVALLEVLGTTNETELASITAPHPFLGVLSGHGWLGMITYHEVRHTRQIRAVKSATAEAAG